MVAKPEILHVIMVVNCGNFQNYKVWNICREYKRSKYKCNFSIANRQWHNEKCVSWRMRGARDRNHLTIGVIDLNQHTFTEYLINAPATKLKVNRPFTKCTNLCLYSLWEVYVNIEMMIAETSFLSHSRPASQIIPEARTSITYFLQ